METAAARTRADIILTQARPITERKRPVRLKYRGRPQLALRAGFAPGEAKENWAILRALSAELGATLPFDSLSALRNQLTGSFPHLAEIDEVPENEWQALPQGKLAQVAFKPAVSDHYLTNPITRASSLMAELSAMAKARAETVLAAE